METPKIVLQEGVFVEIGKDGGVCITERYDGPLGQDRFREIFLTPTAAQKLLDVLVRGGS